MKTAVALVFALACASPGRAQFDFLAPVAISGGRIDFAADLDRDGDLDLVGRLCTFAPCVPTGFWINDGAGGFGFLNASVAFTGARIPVGFFDVDGDSVEDLVYSSRLSGSAPGLYWVSGTTPLPITAVQPLIPLTGGLQPSFFRFGDANADGWTDILLGVSTNQEFVSTIQWYLGGPAGYTPGPNLAFLALVSRQSLETADVNNDGTLDLIAVETTTAGSNLRTFLTSGGVLSASGSQPLTVGNAVAVGVMPGDFDGDGIVDVAAYLPSLGPAYSVRVWQGVGNGTWIPGPTSSGFAGSGSVASYGRFVAVDHNLDGTDDILIRTVQGSNSSRIHVLRGSAGAFTFVGSHLVNSPLTVEDSPFAADLDGDGEPDFVGPAEFLLSTAAARPVVTLQNPVILAAPFDLDRDGDPDWLADNSLSYWTNPGDGSFPGVFPPPSQTLSPPTPTNQVLTGNFPLDVNQDGYLDRVITDSAMPGVPRLFLGSPTTTLVERGPVFNNTTGISVSLTAPVLGDLTGDGIADLAIQAGLGIGNPAGDFSLVLGLWQGAIPVGIDDMEGDGDLDVFARLDPTGSGPTLWGWLRNDGGFVFNPVVTAEVGIDRFSPTYADLDGDGDLDLLALRLAFGAYDILIDEVANGSIASRTVIPAPGLAGSTVSPEAELRVVDLEGDGVSELIALGRNTNGNRVMVWRRNGPGISFGPPTTYLMNLVRQFADLDGDGDLDGVGNAIAFGRAFEGSAAGRRSQYGAGNLGDGGLRAVLGATGPFRVGGPPMVLRARGFVGGAAGFLAASFQTADLPGLIVPSITTYAWPWVATAMTASTGGSPGVPGVGEFDLPVALPPFFLGYDLAFQGAFVDPTTPDGFAATNGLRIQIGN